MRKLLVVASFLILNFTQAQTWKTDEQYIQNFAAYAVEEMEKHKIPASIKLAQGLLETGGGQSRLAKEGNNHFGIKCKEEWTGKTMRHNDDAPNECFRVYDDPRKSYEDHSLFLTQRRYYTQLFSLDIKDYKGWAHGLKKAGYATNPRYAGILINLIEKHRLYEFDNTNSKEVLFTLLKIYPGLGNDTEFMAKQNKKEKSTEKEKSNTLKVPYKQTSYAQQQKEIQDQRTKSKYEVLRSILVKNHPNGGMKYLVVPEDMELQLIARKYGISESRLLKWNELQNGKLKQNDIIFLEPKNAEGNIATYQAESGESMREIAQKFGVRLDKLYAKNRMSEGSEPQPGTLIYLQGKKPRN